MAFVSSFTPSALTRTATPLAGSHCRQQRSRTQRRAHRTPARMVAAKPAVDVEVGKLSDQAIVLMSYIRGHKSVFLPGDGFVGATAALFKKNDTGRTFTPHDQLETNTNLLPGVTVAAYMVDNADALIAQAVDLTMEQSHSTLVSADNQRDVLLYDFNAVLRAISYGAACQAPEFLHPDNIALMKLLHDEADIPGSAVAAALDSVRDTVVAQVDDEDVKTSTVACFNAARDALA